ncbi:precorrin-3B synthase [Azospirillaceae bacterium]
MSSGAFEDYENRAYRRAGQERPHRIRESPCPGLFRIVPARDGGICRIKCPRGRLSVSQAYKVAEAASRFGNGIIEVTNRANLQLRGIGASNGQDQASLIDFLLSAGLGPTVADADDVRNVMISPTSGLDRQEIIDCTDLAAQVLTLLEETPRYHELSPKFSILLDGGGRAAVIDHPHDLWLSAFQDRQHVLFALGFAGCPSFCETEPKPLFAVAADYVVPTIAAALDLFLEIAADQPKIRRFRHILSFLPFETLIARLANRLSFPFIEIGEWCRSAPAQRGPIGCCEQKQAGCFMIGAMPPLGRLSPDMLRGLADMAEQVNEEGDGFRLTPWQSILLPNIRQSRCSEIEARLSALGLLCDPETVLAGVVACSGTAGCASAQSDTKADAYRLSSLLAGRCRPFSIHMTGCPKSCASARRTDVTLLAVGMQHYHIFERRLQSAADWDHPIATNLSLEQITDWMAGRFPILSL